MNLPLIHMYRLTPRGAGGLACDKAGVALGAVDLVRVGADAAGRRRCEVRPRQGLGRILSAAYGPQPEDVVLRLHRGLRRAAAAIEAGDLCLAGIETVLLALPELTQPALAKLAEVAELEKGGTAWENEPRVPAGQPDGGQWTTAGGALALGAEPAAHVSPRAPAPSQKPPMPLEDGVYRPGIDAPHVILAAGEEDEAESRRSNGPPDDFTRLEDVFPGLRDAPGLAIPLAPVDGFLGVSALADEEDLESTLDQYRALVREIKQVDPTFANDELLPPGGIADLTWHERDNLINNLLMQRAAAYYRMRGDVAPLQVETLRFLQNAVDAAYEEAVSEADAGRLQPRLSRAEAIGNWVDFTVRQELKNMFASYGIPYGPGADVTINNRDYETSDDDESYRIPDARFRDVSIDWTLVPKTISTPQIRGLFRADSQPRAVVIVRPSELGSGSTYLIPRPSDVLLWRLRMKPVRMHIAQNIQELLELLTSMPLSAPKFRDKTGYLPFLNIDYVFRQLHEGLNHNRPTLGEERYHELMRMSDRMRVLFEADPENKTGETRKGRDIIYEMEDILKQVRRKS